MGEKDMTNPYSEDTKIGGKMTNKQKIVEFMQGKSQVSVKDIQAGLHGIKPTVVGGTIATDKGNTFTRVSRGIYALKIVQITPQMA
jgi:hypothetical protein